MTMVAILTRLPYSSTSAHTARRHVADALAGLSRDALVADASSLVSELVTNPMIHARTEITLAFSQTTDHLPVDDSKPNAAAFTRATTPTTIQALLR